MRITLRRSCNSCIKSKLSCDLRTPQCSRCAKKKATCTYANQPLTSLQPGNVALHNEKLQRSSRALGNLLSSTKSSISPLNALDVSLDPFHAYPRTKLPRAHEQRLIQHFLSKIAFQYYPLDLCASSNPFIVSWWPLALSDPALFHVSLQTASLDIDLQDQKGFINSEILMADSVSLVRRRVESPSLAIEDATMNSVVTLAAIEYGKGKPEIGKMHIDGVVNMVHLRGGIQQVKLTSPLTARMVAWVSLILTQEPQFPTQDDSSVSLGIAPTAQWIQVATASPDLHSTLTDGLDMETTTSHTLQHLREIFNDTELSKLSTVDFHDLACYVLHRLLSRAQKIDQEDNLQASSVSECVKHAIVLYILTIHGPTYFSHAALQHNSVKYLRAQLEEDLLRSLIEKNISMALWVLFVCMAASKDMEEYQWFIRHTSMTMSVLRIRTWEAVLASLRAVLWFNQLQTENLFRECWIEALGYNEE